jgi:hypothetical protein
MQIYVYYEVKKLSNIIFSQVYTSDSNPSTWSNYRKLEQLALCLYKFGDMVTPDACFRFFFFAALLRRSLT